MRESEARAPCALGGNAGVGVCVLLGRVWVCGRASGVARSGARLCAEGACPASQPHRCKQPVPFIKLKDSVENFSMLALAPNQCQPKLA